MGARRAPGLRARALHVFVLWGFAAVQPVFDQLGRNAHFFVARDSRPAEIVGLALGLCILAPALMALAELAADRLASAAGQALHWTLVALLTAAIILQLLGGLERLPGSLLVAGALALGATVAWAYHHLAAIRTYLSILAPAPLVFAAVFLFASQASRLVWPKATSWQATPPVTRRTPPERTPVVLVVFDELSLPTLMSATRNIDALRYPSFAALASDSHWFRNATATADNTVLALPAILTGKYLAAGHRKIPLATAVNYPQNLFTLLGACGYRLNVFENITELCPTKLCDSDLDPQAPAPPSADRALPPASGALILLSDLSAVYLHSLLPSDLTDSLPPADQQWGDFGFLLNAGENGSGRAEPGAGDSYQAVSGGASSAQATASQRNRVSPLSAFQTAVRAAATDSDGVGWLHFLHIGLPHVPWRYLPSGRHYGTRQNRLAKNGRGLNKGLWVEDEWPVLQGFQRYLLQQVFVDRLLGDLLRTLKETDLYDRALLIVTADHGCSFRPGSPFRRVDRQNFADIMSVPLFIKLPHQHDEVLSDRNVELVDVLPTIAAVLGLDEPWAMDGTSVFDDSARERHEKHFFRGMNRQLVFGVAEMEVKYQTVERMVEAFGPSSDPLALYRIGPVPALVGRPLSDLEVERNSQYSVRLRAPEVFNDVDPATGFVPAHVMGSIRWEGFARQPLKLAVVVGGTVWATTYALKTSARRARFSAVVPESAFVAGRNQIEVFVVSGTPDRSRLIPARRRTADAGSRGPRRVQGGSQAVEGGVSSLRRSLPRGGGAASSTTFCGTTFCGWKSALPAS